MSIPVPVRRGISWAVLLICTALVAVAALAFTLASHRYPLSAVVLTDIPAFAGILGARVCLHATERRKP